uniref:Ig-like domain-containing protein n=1 Tax=Megaselia scalaris TaxID=36166 RepID=T1GJU7_MEGSC
MWKEIDLHESRRELKPWKEIKNEIPINICQEKQVLGLTSSIIDMGWEVLILSEIKEERRLSLNEPNVSEYTSERRKSNSQLRLLRNKLQTIAPMKNIFQEKGNKLLLEWKISGPVESVTWYKGDERILPDSRIKMYNINGCISLEVHDSSVNDSGNYRCIVKNSLNSIEMMSDVNIYNQFDMSCPISQAFTSSIKD